MTFDEIKLTAEARADVDCQRGLADLAGSIDGAPEFVSYYDERKHVVAPVRVHLTNMRDFLAESIERERVRRGKS